MDGVVRSYTSEKRYGFIDGSDGNSYFFHESYFIQPSPLARKLCKGMPVNREICKGMPVNFDPTPAPKGLQARKLRVLNRHLCWVQPKRFVVTKADVPTKGKIFHKTPPIEFGLPGNPDDAKSELIYQAESLGANALLGLSYYRALN